MKTWLVSIANRILPRLDEAGEQTRSTALAEIVNLVFALPLAAVGLAWLASITQVAPLAGRWMEVLLLFGMQVLFEGLTFFYVEEPHPDILFSIEVSMGPVIWISMLFMFGPSILWLRILYAVSRAAIVWLRHPDGVTRLLIVQTLFSLLAEAAPLMLLGLIWYERAGGRYPMPGLALDGLGLAFTAALIILLLTRLIWLPYVIFSGTRRAVWHDPAVRRQFFLMHAVRLAWPVLLAPFGVLTAALYAEHGLWIYLIFTGGFVMAGILANQLSKTIHRMQQRTRELDHLDQLSRAILQAPPDASTLPDLLKHHIPGMFFMSIVELNLFSQGVLVHDPPEYPRLPPQAWDWIRHTNSTQIIPPNTPLPWGGAPSVRYTITLPILAMDDSGPIGAICITRRRQRGPVEDPIHAAQSLAALIASTLHQADVYQAALDHQRTLQELTLAGEIQASFLPESEPEIEGWQIAAALEPARETSGDFFDLIPMWDGRLGVVVADVADKGMGAALFMALSRTLIRTYATEYATRYPDTYAFHPERVLNTVNQLIIRDTSSNLFVTLFYGIIDPKLGILTYANAGHNPPFLVHCKNTHGQRATATPVIRALPRTGIPLGILEDRVWERGSVEFKPGDVLVLYTDGVTEAQNGRREFFDEDRLVQTIRRAYDRPAREIHQAIVEQILNFVGEEALKDDATLVIVKREPVGLEA